MKKTLVTILLPIVALMIGFTTLTTFAANNTLESSKNFSQKGFGHGFAIETLTDEQKSALDAMSDDEKRAYLSEQRTLQEQKRSAQEAIIDKLLARETLNSEEEAIRTELIAERAKQKAAQVEQKARQEQIQAIFTKKQSGETLTAEEESLISSFPKRGAQNHAPRQRVNTEATNQ